MWTTLVFTLVSFVFIAEATYDPSPPYPPPLETTITCLAPGNYNGKKRFVSAPDREPIPAEELQLNLIVGQIDEFWELPLITTKEPGIPDYDDTDFTGVLDSFLNLTAAEGMVSRNMPGVIAQDPNPLFGITDEPFEVPDDLLTGLSADEANTIRNYVATAEIGDCSVTYAWRERPPFYYPRFQIYGRCDGRDDCAIPLTDDHAFSQRCRPDLTDQIRIRALRWDCCHSFTDDDGWEYICGWRAVSVPIVNQCTCMCGPGDEVD